MIRRELLSEIKRLSREDKLTIFQVIADDLSTDEGNYFEGRSTFKQSPLIRATDEAKITLVGMEHQVPRRN